VNISAIRQKITSRNTVFEKTRSFFKDRNVLEVDTALVRAYTVTDPYMSVFSVRDEKNSHCGYLQTSPEYAMKNLLSQGSGDIFQMSKMFRSEEKSRYHAEEFTLLEWYRLHWTHIELMNEVALYIQMILGSKKIHYISYQDLFKKKLNLDPFSITQNEIHHFSIQRLGELPNDLSIDDYLHLLFSEFIEKTFIDDTLIFIHSYPPSQASLAQLSERNHHCIADRFEVYCGQKELANGFNELTDPKEQIKRFEQDRFIRKKNNKPLPEIDPTLIDSLNIGLPTCSGVALGIDRLLMLKQDAHSISDVII
jgi:lysyl-tRNA synthetase class 2